MNGQLTSTTIDCTATFRFAEEQRRSIFLALMHRSLSAAHTVENFHTRFVDGEVRRFEQISGGSAVGRANGTIGFGFYYAGADFIRYSILPASTRSVAASAIGISCQRRAAPGAGNSTSRSRQRSFTASRNRPASGNDKPA